MHGLVRSVGRNHRDREPPGFIGETEGKADLAPQDTLASVIYTSPSARRTDVGVILQRCLLCLGLLFIPFGFLWWNIHPVLILLGQTDELATNCQAFLRVLVFGAPGYIAFESVKKFLQVQGA